MMRNKSIRAVIFILVGIFLLSGVSTVMVRRAADARVYQWYGSFYKEKKGSLDAVYIGSSTTYAFWEAPLAWEKFGIAIHPLTCPRQPFEAAEYIIREARKTQPDALYMIPISSLSEKVTNVEMHYTVDNMPLSWNKIQMVQTLGDYMGLDWTRKLEFLFPLIRYHSRWNELQESDFLYPFDGFKGASNYKSFLRTSLDVSSSYYVTEDTAPLSKITQDALDNLLEYCDAEQVNVLFIAMPRSAEDEEDKTIWAKMNTVEEIVQARGYPVFDMQSDVEEIGLNFTKDYYNEHHTNIHGAIKITDYISRYLMENYDFKDKRGDPAYSSWDEAYASYTKKYASAYTLDVEWEGNPRDNTLAAPAIKTAVTGTTITVSWETVPKADGYRIYRKSAVGNSWEIVDTVGADIFSYDDPDRKAGTTYYYTVIAYREEDNIRYWGDYNFAGVTAKAEAKSS